MRAAWWWIDRWRKSSAYICMNAEEQGVYRNLLDELWLRDGLLPLDDDALAKISGDPKAWPRVAGVVLARFKRTRKGYRNDTHDAIRRDSKRRADRQKRHRERRRDGNVTRNVMDNVTCDVTTSPSPSPSLRTSRSIGLIDRQNAPPANPLVGSRSERETELLRLVQREAELTSRDGVEIMAEVSDYEGSTRSKLNPATMTDDRLLNSLMDARARVARLEKANGGKTRSEN